jgi:hypothetical protein
LLNDLEVFVPIYFLLERSSFCLVDPDTALQNVAYARCNNSEQQLELLEKLGELFISGEFRLLIIDSVMACFRVDYLGRGELSERQQKLGQFLDLLKKIAENFNVCVFMVRIATRSICPILMSSRQTKCRAILVLVHSSRVPMAANLLVVMFWLMLRQRVSCCGKGVGKNEWRRSKILQVLWYCTS